MIKHDFENSIENCKSLATDLTQLLNTGSIDASTMLVVDDTNIVGGHIYYDAAYNILNISLATNQDDDDDDEDDTDLPEFSLVPTDDDTYRIQPADCNAVYHQVPCVTGELFYIRDNSEDTDLFVQKYIDEAAFDQSTDYDTSMSIIVLRSDLGNLCNLIGLLKCDLSSRKIKPKEMIDFIEESLEFGIDEESAEEIEKTIIRNNDDAFYGAPYFSLDSCDMDVDFGFTANMGQLYFLSTMTEECYANAIMDGRIEPDIKYVAIPFTCTPEDELYESEFTLTEFMNQYYDMIMEEVESRHDSAVYKASIERIMKEIQAYEDSLTE